MKLIWNLNFLKRFWRTEINSTLRVPRAVTQVDGLPPAQVTRRVEFSILTSRVIRLQGKSDFSSMQQIGSFKVKVPIIGDGSYVQFSILLHFREALVSYLPSKKYGRLPRSDFKAQSQMSDDIFFFLNAVFKKNEKMMKFWRFFFKVKISKLFFNSDTPFQLPCRWRI